MSPDCVWESRAGGTTYTTPSLWAVHSTHNLQAVTLYTYALTIPYGALLLDETALRDTAEALEIAEQSGDDSHRSVLEPPGVSRSSIGAVRTVKSASSCWGRPASEA